MKDKQIRTIVLGIFRHEDRLLVFEGYDPIRDVTFYRPLGGGIEFGEYGRQALIREMREELAADITGLRYMGAIENIFTHAGGQGHEIVLVYEARFVDPDFYRRSIFTGAEDNGAPITVSWKPLSDFRNGAFLVPIELRDFLDLGHAS